MACCWRTEAETLKLGLHLSAKIPPANRQRRRRAWLQSELRPLIRVD